MESFDTELTPIVKIPDNQPTIAAAWSSLGSTGGVIEIQNSSYHDVNAPVNVPAGAKIEIRAAEGCRPVIRVNGHWTITGEADAALSLNGLLICGGQIEVPLTKTSGGPNKLYELRLAHCTLCPVLTPFDGMATTLNPRLIVQAADVEVNISRSIIGGLRVADIAETTIRDTIIDVGDPMQLAFGGNNEFEFGGPLTVHNSTIIGRVKTRIMQLASNTIFHAKPGIDPGELPVEVERLQEGCVRFSYVPPGSRVPRPYRCQPANEADALRVKPVFTSLRYSDAAYGQLGIHCPAEITRAQRTSSRWAHIITCTNRYGNSTFEPG